MKSLATAALAGAVFAAGLMASGMTDPSRIIAFLDISHAWDPRLAFVMGGALGTHALLRFMILRRRARPLLAERFESPTGSRVDARLLGGAALFGVGWGIAGYCPGPAITALASGASSPLLFVAAMLGGMALARWGMARASARRDGAGR